MADVALLYALMYWHFQYVFFADTLSWCCPQLIKATTKEERKQRVKLQMALAKGQDAGIPGGWFQHQVAAAEEFVEKVERLAAPFTSSKQVVGLGHVHAFGSYVAYMIGLGGLTNIKDLAFGEVRQRPKDMCRMCKQENCGTQAAYLCISLTLVIAAASKVLDIHVCDGMLQTEGNLRKPVPML